MNVNLVLFQTNGTTKSFHLPSSVTTIGRRQDCDLCIPLMVVSRKHCELNQDQCQLRIRDLGSRNGITVNGNKVEDAQLSPGDRINIGPLSFAVQIDGVPPNDSEIFRPPKNGKKFEEPAEDKNTEEILDIDDFDMSGISPGPGKNSSDIFDETQEEVSNNNIS